MLEAGGAQKLIEFWHEEGADQALAPSTSVDVISMRIVVQELDDEYSVRYWAPSWDASETVSQYVLPSQSSYVFLFVFLRF